MKKFKLYLGITSFVKSLILVGIMIALIIKKRSIPKALIALLGVTSVASALLLVSYDSDTRNMKKMKKMDAFYDYDYYDEDDYDMYTDEDSDEPLKF